MATNAPSESDVGVGAQQEGVFVRRSSGLVRDVSPIKALFFSVAAVFGGGMAFTFQNMTVTGQPLWTFGFTSYAWAILAVAAALALYGILMATLTSAMPRAGANYVFTSRILSPFVAWLESFCLLIAVISVIAILLPLALLMFNYTGAAMEIAFPDSSLFDGAAGWFSDSESLFIGGTVMVVLACLFAILPSQLFYRLLTVLGFVALITVVLVFIVTPFLSHDTFLGNVTEITGQTPEQIIETGAYPQGELQLPRLHGDVLVRPVRLLRLPVRVVRLGRDVRERQADGVVRVTGHARARRVRVDHLQRRPGPQVRARAHDIVELPLLDGRRRSRRDHRVAVDPRRHRERRPLADLGAPRPGRRALHLAAHACLPRCGLADHHRLVARPAGPGVDRPGERANERPDQRDRHLRARGRGHPVPHRLPGPPARRDALVHDSHVPPGSPPAGIQCDLRQEATTRPLRRDLREAASARDRLAPGDQHHLRDGDLQADLRGLQRRHLVPELLRRPGLRSSRSGWAWSCTSSPSRGIAREVSSATRCSRQSRRTEVVRSESDDFLRRPRGTRKRWCPDERLGRLRPAREQPARPSPPQGRCAPARVELGQDGRQRGLDHRAARARRRCFSMSRAPGASITSGSGSRTSWAIARWSPRAATGTRCSGSSWRCTGTARSPPASSSRSARSSARPMSRRRSSPRRRSRSALGTAAA